MSTKKRFSIAPDLASGIRNTIQTASTSQGQLHYDMMTLDMLEPDPNNPRKLSITRDDILNGLKINDPDYQIKSKEFDALKELSESIKRIGIKNAIEVYKDGAKYRIVTGERRYWAAFLAAQKTVPVRISQKPDEFNLRYTQWVENINRQDLSLWEKFNNLLLIADAYKKSNQGEFTEQALQSLLGISNIQAYRYYSLLKADEKIIQLVQIGKLNNLKIVQELVSMKDKGARNQIISWILSSKDEVTSLANYRETAGKKNQKSKTEKSISLGKVNNSTIAKQLFEIVLSSSQFEKYRQNFNKIDWSSAKDISKAFKALIKVIERECSVEEIA
jgi:ParB family chromosome partitioning protein